MDSPAALVKQLKAAEPFFLLAGPNVIESEEHILKMAKHIKTATSRLGLPVVFKSSFYKANRTSSKSFCGPGLEQGLKKVKVAYDLPIITDVHESSQCEAVGRVADIIQIPAFLCRQTDLLVAAAKTGKNHKYQERTILCSLKSQVLKEDMKLFMFHLVMVNSAEKIRLAGNANVILCERDDLIVDPRKLEWMREANCPVLDGGRVASGGLRELLLVLMDFSWRYTTIPLMHLLMVQPNANTKLGGTTRGAHGHCCMSFVLSMMKI